MKFKKSFAGIILSAAILLCSCGKSESKRPELDFDYSCNAEISVDEQLYKTEITKSASQWTFTYTYPAELEGMVVAMDDESCTIDYNGLEMVSDRDCVPDSCVCDFVAKSLEYIAHGSGIDFTEKDEIITGKGILDGGDLTVTYNKNKLPEKVKIGNNICIKIDNMQKSQRADS